MKNTLQKGKLQMFKIYFKNKNLARTKFFTMCVFYCFVFREWIWVADFSSRLGS